MYAYNYASLNMLNKNYGMLCVMLRVMLNTFLTLFRSNLYPCYPGSR